RQRLGLPKKDWNSKVKKKNNY
ncbi:hypothetical protein LCGC14_2308830, partial [marine sediment metagenome]